MKNILKLSAFFALCAALVFGLAACGDNGDGNGTGSNTALIVGTWDLTEVQGGDDPGPVSSGTATLVITDTDYTVTFHGCIENGTYTADSTTFTVTVVTVVGSCGSPGDMSTAQYAVNSTTLTTIEGGETMIWQKIL